MSGDSVSNPGSPTPGKGPISQQELTNELSKVFGQVEVVFTKPDDPQIPGPMQMTAKLAAARGFQLPEVIAGIVCGRSPQPLSAFVVSDYKQFVEFRKANPGLKDTLASWWPGMPPLDHQVQWLRCADGIAKNVACASMMWVASGIVPVAVVWEANHFLLAQSPVLGVKFSEIKWPVAVEGMFLAPRLEQLFGPRYTSVGGKTNILNSTFWAHFVAQKCGLTFIIDRNAFFLADNGETVQVSDENVLRLVMEVLRKASAVDYGFPTANLRPAVAKQVVEEMKVAVAMHLPGKEEALTVISKGNQSRCIWRRDV